MSKTSGIGTKEMHAKAAEMAGERVADWLRREYPEPRAKVIARQFNVSPRTVENWLAGTMPQNRAWLDMCALWGRRFSDHVLEPLVGMPKTDQQILQDIADMQARLADIHARHMALVKEEA